MQIFLRFISVFIIILLGSCTNEKQTPKVTYDSSKKEKVIEKDTSMIVVLDLPIHLKGTKYLLFPIGEIRVFNDKGSKYESNRSESVSYSISNYDDNEITGYFDNLKIQHIDSISSKNLSSNKMQIQSVTYLKNIAEKTTKQFLLYTLADNDTNQDGIINSNDIKSLYISSIDGSNFIKLSKEFHELIDWNIIEVQNKLYFRSIEDINKNGAFDKNDKIHYHFVNLLDKELKAEILAI